VSEIAALFQHHLFAVDARCSTFRPLSCVCLKKVQSVLPNLKLLVLFSIKNRLQYSQAGTALATKVESLRENLEIS